MKRRRRKKHINLNIVLIIIFFITIVGVGYSYLSEVLQISGQITGEVNEGEFTVMEGSNPNLSIDISKGNTWQEGSLYKNHYYFTVTNIGTEIIDNFKITATFFNIIDSIAIWNYDYNLDGNELIITNNKYHLASNQSVTVDFILASTSSKQFVRLIKLDVLELEDNITLDEFNVDFNITNGWGNYTYQYNVILTNKTGSTINAWQLNITLPNGTSYIKGWSAKYTYEDNILTIKNESYNGRLDDNQSITIGLQLSTNIINFIPSDITIMVR